MSGLGPVTTRAVPSPRTVPRRLRRRPGAARRAGSDVQVGRSEIKGPSGLDGPGSVMFKLALPKSKAH